MDIEEMNAEKLATTLHACIARLGDLGREGRVALVERLNGNGDVLVDEGMAQLGDALAEVGVD